MSLIAHRRAFKETEINLFGRATKRSYLHDIDKFVLNLLPSRIERWIHRRINTHHSECWFGHDYIAMIIDWECARLTKPSKQLNARQTLEKYYPSLKSEIEPILNTLGL